MTESCTIHCPPGRRGRSKILDADHARRFEHRVERGDASSARRIAASSVRWVVITTGTASPGARPRWIINSIETCSSRKGRRDIGDDAGLIEHHQPDVIGAMVPLDRHAGDRRKCRRRQPEAARGGRRRYRRGRRRLPSGRESPAPPPWNTTRPTKSPSATTALNTPSTAAIGVARGTMQGWTRCSSPSSVSRAMPSSLMRIAELFREVDVEPRDVTDPLGVDPVENRPVGRKRRSPGSPACARHRPRRCRSSDRPRHSRASAPRPAPRRIRARSRASSSGCSSRCR